MSSKQLNFFITEKDLLAVYLFFKEMNCLLVKNNVANIEEAIISPNEIVSSHSFQLFLVPQHYNKEIYFKYLQSRDYYYVDIERSAVVEFDFGGFFSNELHRSRFYFITKYYNDDGDASKDSEFIQWGDKLFKQFKKQFLKKSINGDNVLLSDVASTWFTDVKAGIGGGGLKLVPKDSSLF